MIMDRLLQFANSLPLPTTGTGIFNVGDQLDMQVIQDIGIVEALQLVVTVMVAVISAGAATVQFILASDSQVPLRTDGATENIHIESQAIPKATLVAQYQVPLRLPAGTPGTSATAGTGYARYLGLQVNIGTAALTGGSISAGLSRDPAGFRPYPGAVLFS